MHVVRLDPQNPGDPDPWGVPGAVLEAATLLDRLKGILASRIWAARLDFLEAGLSCLVLWQRLGAHITSLPSDVRLAEMRSIIDTMSAVQFLRENGRRYTQAERASTALLTRKESRGTYPASFTTRV